ncbi:MAG: TadE family protein [Planctomycetaceae bacterium]
MPNNPGQSPRAPSYASPRCRGARRLSRRRGAAIIEGAIVIGVFLVILLGTLDLGLAVLRYNVLSEAARRLARSATLHGERAAPERSAWGPDTYKGTAGDGSDYAGAINKILVTMELNDVKISLEWLDDGNASGDRVLARLDVKHHTIIPFLFGKGDLQLTAKSVMRIEH